MEEICLDLSKGDGLSLETIVTEGLSGSLT